MKRGKVLLLEQKQTKATIAHLTKGQTWIQCQTGFLSRVPLLGLRLGSITPVPAEG
jgi:hypothetical protein